MKQTRSVLPLALLALAAWALWRLSLHSAPNIAQNADKPPEYLDFYASNLHVHTLDAKGKPMRELQASELRHFMPEERTELDQPVLDLHNQENPWRVVAHQGEVSEQGDKLFLGGEVIMDRAASQAKPAMHMETQDVSYYTERNYAETDAAVHITSQDNWITAQGMQAWLDEPPHFRFLANAKGHYVDQNP